MIKPYKVTRPSRLGAYGLCILGLHSVVASEVKVSVNIAMI